MKLKLNQIYAWDDLLEIRPVNDVIVSQYRQAMRAGANFPPVVVEKVGKRFRLIAGNHRANGYVQEYGDEHEIEAEIRKYDTDADRIEDAIRDNSKHGLRLDGITRKRVICRLSQLGRSPESIATLLLVSVKRVEELGGMTVVIRGNQHPQPIKHGLDHMAGTVVTAAQYKEHSVADRGVPVVQQAKQLARWIRNGWVNMDDPKTAAAIAELKEVIETL
jgi:hypothetical protein